MPKVSLRLRDLESGNAGVSEHESVEAATDWLRARPSFVEVLGVVFEGITREESMRMKDAMRPLEPEERVRAQALDDAEAKDAADRREAARKEAEEEAIRARAAAKNADPNRPMEIRYRYDSKELTKADALDDRPISDEARKAVMEWIAEREEWVRGRGQTVGEAKVQVYPNAVPVREARVITGSFVPIACEAKDWN